MSDDNKELEKKKQQKTIKLHDGVEIPVIGLGTFQNSQNDSVEVAIKTAIESDYHLIDTAELYQNEKMIGDALKKYLKDKPNYKVFITTKLKMFNTQRSLDSVVEQVEKQLKDLQRPYIDLYLLHSPHTNDGGKDILAIYEALHELKKQGKIRSIGVSNFNIYHLKILDKYKLPKPSVNQIEVHPFCIETELIEYCKKSNIVIQAYCPVARGQSFSVDNSKDKISVFEHPKIANLAKKYAKTPAQILIRWGIDCGFVSLPKSSNPKRIKENVDVFDFYLEEDEVATLSKLNQKQHVSWNVINIAWNSV